MKKSILLLSALALTTCLLCAGCADGARSASPEKTSAVDAVLGEQTETRAPAPVQTPAAPAPTQTEEQSAGASPGSSDGIDIDLTAMSSTMVYAEVFSMMENPAAYVGKTVKARGPYYASFYEPTGKYYHFVVIADATACCSQGLEFIWNGTHIYPDDYPADGTEVEIVGVFGIYEEEGYTYCYLAVDDIVVTNVGG